MGWSCTDTNSKELYFTHGLKHNLNFPVNTFPVTNHCKLKTKYAPSINIEYTIKIHKYVIMLLVRHRCGGYIFGAERVFLVA